MKKILRILTIAITFLVFGRASEVKAFEVKSTDIPNSTYVIGTHMFTREVSSSYNGSLSTNVIMFAAKTIESDELDDMVIYYKNARGIWVDALTSKQVQMDESLEIKYKNLEIYLKTPTLSAGAGSKGHAMLDIKIDGYYAENSSEIAGWTLYEKVGTTYTKIKDIEGVETYDARADVGEKKIFVAKVYALNKSGEKVYSEYSNEFVLDNSKVETPTLSAGAGSKGHAMLDIKIDGYYAENSSEIAGWTLYEKVGTTYTKIKDIEGVETYDARADVGEKKIFVAKVYALNKSGEKVYSEYSNEFVLDNSKVETPTLSAGAGSKGHAMLDIKIDGYYAENSSEIAGWTLYEKVGTTYTKIKDIEGVETYDARADVGEKKIFVAKVYALNKSGEKVYSEYSNEFVLDNSKVETPTLSAGAGSKGHAMLDIKIDGYYAENSSEIAGWTLYEKVGTTYTKIKDIEGVETYDARADVGEKKIFVAKVYALNKSGEKVYSEYSNEFVLDNSN